jgi:hypothetical protein
MDPQVIAPETSDIVVLLARLCCTLLALTPHCRKVSIYEIKLPTLQSIDDLLRSSGFRFAPTLVQILQSKTPPSIADLKRLPLHLGDFWAVYLHVLEKPGHRPRIYIGSATGKRYGWTGRYNQYTKAIHHLPYYYKRYINDGYVRTHTGLLCWAPNPTASKRIMLRVLFLLVEAALTIGLWSIVSAKDYEMPHLCFWKVDSLVYGGLNSHFSIQEGVQDGDSDLTAEEIDAFEEALKEAAREAARLRTRLANEKRGVEATNAYNAQTRTKHIAEKRHHCRTCNKFFGQKVHLAEHNLTKAHLDKVAGITKAIQRPDHKRRNANNKLLKKFWCGHCSYAAPTQQALDKHLATDKHSKKAGASHSKTKNGSESTPSIQAYLV